MKLKLVLLLSVFLFSCKPPSPRLPAHSPAKLSLQHLSIVQSQSGEIDKTLEVFLSNGSQWRSEAIKPGKGTVVVIFDGKDLKTNSVLEPEKKGDWRQIFSSLFQMLEPRHFVGTVEAGGFKCWQYKHQEKGTDGIFLIDEKMLIPRKWVIKHKDGKKEWNYFFDFPNQEGKDLFNIAQLEPKLINKVTKGWGDGF